MALQGFAFAVHELTRRVVFLGFALLALTCCLLFFSGRPVEANVEELLAKGHGLSITREPEVFLLNALENVQRERLDQAQILLEDLIRDNPDFRLAQLVYADVLAARAGALRGLGAGMVPDEELAGLADIQVGADYSVTLDGETVVSGNGSIRAALEVTSGGPPATFELDGTAVGITSGSIGAWSDVLDIAAGMRDRLDTLASDLMDAVNDIHNSDRNLAGDTYDLLGERCNWDFFSGTGASDVAVNLLIYDPASPLDMDARLVAAAASRYEDGPPPVPNPGDGAIALQIADLAGQTRAALGDQTFGDYHTTGLAMLGGLIQSERYLAEDGQAIADALENSLQAEIGVNMDEELMTMLQAQRAYESAAQVLTTIDEMIQTILQL